MPSKIYQLAEAKVAHIYGKAFAESLHANQLIAIYYKILDKEKKTLYSNSQLALFM